MNPEIKQRIDLIRHGEVPEGYCQAKDCIYPSDWICKKMSDWLELIERPLTLEDQETYQLVTARRSFGGVDSRGYYKGRDVLVKTYFEVKEGDFLISKRQIAHGACGIVPKSLNCAVVSNEYNLFVPKTGTNIELFNMMMQLPHYKRLFYLMSDGVHIEKLLFKTKDWMKRVIAMPPLPEQQKIAEILTTQDKLIELQARKIEQLQALKKAYLQRMFPKKGCDRPEIRFAGFTDAWEQRKVKDIAENTYGGGTPQTSVDSFWNGDIPWIQSQDIIENQLFDVVPRKHISEEAVSKSATKLVSEKSIAIVTRVGVGKLAFMTFSYCTSQDFLSLSGIRIDEKFAVYSIYKMLQKEKQNVQGTSIKGITIEEMLSKNIEVPCNNAEQQKIGTYFRNLDHLITLHQRKLDEEKQKKKALMQLLLTGIVRVKI